MFVGSEGTLGVIAEITVRLYPQPEAVSAAVVNFPTIRGAVDTVIQTIQMGVPIARSEFLDAATIKAINAYSKLSLREQTTLFFEFHGTEAGVRSRPRPSRNWPASMAGRISSGRPGPDRTRLWNARHNAYFACLQARPGARAISTDTCVPISRLADSLTGAREILDRAAVP
ncbi:MAG: FAD-linked oxidase C-terminal domain-containing protein [Burkholderiaceae bacterium]